MVTLEEVHQAYSDWQSEESRDRGWDGDKVRQLRDRYFELSEEYDQQLEENT